MPETDATVLSPASLLEAVFRIPELLQSWDAVFFDFWGLLAGGLFVAFYAKSRFENPAGNRSSTTCLRYYSTLSLYVLSAITLFLFIEILLRASPTLLTAVAAMIDPNAGPEPGARPADGGSNRSTYLFAALCMTVFLPTIGPLRRIDERLKRLFQDIAVIPHQVLLLAARLEKADFDPAPETAKASTAITAILDRSATDGGHIAHRLTRKWLRLRSMILFMDDIRREPKYARFLDRFDDLEREASGHYESIRAAVEDCLRIASGIDLKAVEGQESVQQAVRKYFRSIESSVDRCARRYHRLIARAVLACETSGAARLARLRQAGYRKVRFERANLQSFFNHVSFAFVIVIATMLLVSVIGPYLTQADPAAGADAQAPDPLGSVLLAVRIALVFSVATFWGVIGLGRPVGNRHESEGEGADDMSPESTSGFHRRWGQYFIAGALATVSQIIVNFLMNVAVYRDFVAAFEQVPRSLPWAVTVFALAYVLAMLCETRRLPGRRSRFMDAAVLGATLALSGFVTTMLIMQSPEMFIGRAFDYSMLFVVPATAALIGALLGFIIPESYRRDQRGSSRRDRLYRSLMDDTRLVAE